MLLASILRGPPRTAHNNHRQLFSSLFPSLLMGCAGLFRGKKSCFLFRQQYISWEEQFPGFSYPSPPFHRYPWFQCSVLPPLSKNEHLVLMRLVKTHKTSPHCASLLTRTVPSASLWSILFYPCFLPWGFKCWHWHAFFYRFAESKRRSTADGGHCATFSVVRG